MCVRSPGLGGLERRDDVAIIFDSGADVALFPLNMADHGEGELAPNSATKLQDAQGDCMPTGCENCRNLPARSSVQK